MKIWAPGLDWSTSPNVGKVASSKIIQIKLISHYTIHITLIFMENILQVFSYYSVSWF